ncbi:hypothetical protein CXG81DRAFT_13641 [Caulochytrium protostelioides]|uniref:Probable valine--tRNA ligase, cytoplasmic n=1 Tax=Caulochytrium protostelioides TaxID=1555241 RepID=A0A4P9X4T5_9FUNG|nr:hypothetical protein CXG81DRAFT_13641 [Caulochytrium protostelioides]|eukprot:RKP00108.1 hypothetical protein CXG81DRAFT_13641 [Caulochytrium protostelioides]
MSDANEAPASAAVTPAAADPAGQTAAKSKNEAKNEAKRLAKLAKLEAKKAAQAVQAAALAAKKAAAGAVAETASKAANTALKVAGDASEGPETPAGEKKDLSAPMAAAYDPRAVEKAWDAWWEAQDVYKPTARDDHPEGPFMLTLPPPNVTGSLHLGHGLTLSIQDALVRWNRMRGRPTLWLPGTDHAGIATQVVVEKRIARDTGKTRHDLGRERFIEEVWKWKTESGGHITKQMRIMGASLDWSREVFTMDDKLSKAVTEAFIRLHEKGTIYRETRLVNWCTKLKTALSNLEVETIELTGPTMMSLPDHDPSKKYEFGTIISFAYPIENSDEKIVVATTRLETMLGDTAVCVHPKDARYAHLVGRHVVHPFNGRRIPIIADEYADPEKGTGAVKITPAHDFNDYAVGKRNNLGFINVLTDDGLINEEGGERFQGLRRFDARLAICDALKQLGLYVETKPNPMQLPMCPRSNNIVEPMLKPQWYVNTQTMAKRACDAVTDKKLVIEPATSEREWFKWLGQPQDWCISRQLWWGHRVPAYLIEKDGRRLDEFDPQSWVSAHDHAAALAKAVARYPDAATIVLHHDEDVLDTWFSSALFPFSTLGWPDSDSVDLQRFYPNSMLETGWDILFFWVARMVMLGLELMDDVPFKYVFCHALVRDAHGRKMSKSLGNVIDPLDVVNGITLDQLQEKLAKGNLDPAELQRARAGQREDYPNGISACGADALRFTLLAYTAQGRDINLDVMRIEGYRKFCNKIWNAVKFALMKLPASVTPQPLTATLQYATLGDRWILSRLAHAVRDVDASIRDMNFMNACSAIHGFWLYDFCDVYLETSKTVLDEAAKDPQAGVAGSAAQLRQHTTEQVLFLCLDTILRLMHPFMPYLSEELWQRVMQRAGPHRPAASICVAAYPEPAQWTVDAQALAQFEDVQAVCRAARSLLSDFATVRNAQLTVLVTPDVTAAADAARIQAERVQLLTAEKAVLVGLVKNAAQLTVVTDPALAPKGAAATSVMPGMTLFLALKGFVDLGAEVAKLQTKRAKAEQLLQSWVKKTQIPDYETKVRAEVRQANDAKIQTYQADVAALDKAIAEINRLIADAE